MVTRLRRPDGETRAPERIVHLGLGAFHRAHQAWYTGAVDTERAWGIAAFTGRRADAATTLAAQDGLYTLVERGPGGDEFTVVRSVVGAYDGADLARLSDAMAAPATAVVTLTVTEPAYLVGAAGFSVDDPDVAADLAAWHSTSAEMRPQMREPTPTPALTTMPARLAYGLDARRRAGARPLAVVSCDNLADNGRVARASVRGFAAAVNGALADWIDANVSFVSTSVDRITPRTTPADVELVATQCGYDDRAPVVTEPFSDWVLCGLFPAGRPAWERAGAIFVDDIAPWEQRKLWMLNGAHSLLAYLGLLRGRATVAEAIADDPCRRGVEALWQLVATHLTEPELDLPRYRRELLDRWRNPRIEHQLAQIGLAGSTKLRNRMVPLVEAEWARGATGNAGLHVVAAWAEYLSRLPSVSDELDAAAARLNDARGRSGIEQTRALLAVLEPAWARDDAVVELVAAQRRLVRTAVDEG